jgi:hypothetical protein
MDELAVEPFARHLAHVDGRVAEQQAEQFSARVS